MVREVDVWLLTRHVFAYSSMYVVKEGKIKEGLVLLMVGSLVVLIQQMQAQFCNTATV